MRSPGWCTSPLAKAGGEAGIHPQVPKPQATRPTGVLLPSRRKAAAGDQTRTRLLFPHSVSDACQEFPTPPRAFAQAGASLAPRSRRMTAWHVPLGASLGTRGSGELLPALASSTFIHGDRSQKPALPLLATCARCTGWHRKPSWGAPRAAQMVHDTMGMGWTSGAGATSHASRERGCVRALGRTSDWAHRAQGMKLPDSSRLLMRSCALTLRWSSWACGPPLPSIS